MKNIFVSGGAGYIGSVLVPKLLENGYKVTVLDNFMYQQNSLAPHFINKNLTVVNGDVRNIELVNTLTKKADIIIPLAAIVGAPACNKDPISATAINKHSVIDMLKNISDSQWVIMPTTNSGYGASKHGEYLTELSTLNPLSLYAKDKVELEKKLMLRAESTSFRLATVFGMSPRMRLDLLVNSFVKSAINPGYVILFEAEFRRNYIHVIDVASAFIFAINNPDKFRGQIFNVGLSSANLTKRELANKVFEQHSTFRILESEINQDPDKRDYLVSNKKIEETGFNPMVTLETGIKELLSGLSTLKWELYNNL
jgi:nucleoside-diphosphate-sugar epimerase